MAGAGVRAANLPLFLQAGVKEVHSSAGHWLPSEMRFRHPGVSMSADPDADEYRRYAVNGAAVAEMKRIISATGEVKRFFAAHHVAQYDDCPYRGPCPLNRGLFLSRFFRQRLLGFRFGGNDHSP